MEEKKLFSSFRAKLILEAVLKAALRGIAVCGASVFLISLIRHVQLEATPWGLCLAVGGILFLLTAVISFVFDFPKEKRIAARMDAMGLKERVGTMLQLRGSDSEIARLQRRDALEKAKGIRAKDMPLSIHRYDLIVSAVSVALAAAIAFLPYNAFAFGRPDLGAENRAFVDDLIRELKEKAEDDRLRDELQEELEELLEELEEELKKSESELEQAAKLEEALEKLDELFKEEVSGDLIGKALQEFELTRPLGEAIEAADEEKVRAAMADLKKQIEEEPAIQKELPDIFYEALRISFVPDDDALFQAIFNFAFDLEENPPESETWGMALEEIFPRAERAILKALKQQSESKSVKDSMKDAMEQAKKEALGKGQKKPKPEEEETKTEGGGEEETATAEEGGEKETQEAQKPQQSQQPPKGGGGTGGGAGADGDGESTPNEMLEPIFDPVSGQVTYGEVFALYYAEYLEALKEGRLTDEERERMDRYFSSLN